MIRIGIYGYGNLARGVECAIKQNNDMKLVAVFSRRDPSSIKLLHSDVKAYSVDDVLSFKDKIDVLVLCGGSATDLPDQSPLLAKDFNIIDSYDNHAMINKHFDNVNQASLSGSKVALIGVGWDPGMFSINRLYSNLILPNGSDYTFWGKGVSQGHSDAIRRISGVVDAKQYTIPKDDAINLARSGNNPILETRDKHLRECYVVATDGANEELIEKTIKEMPGYFDAYDTIVNFISKEELDLNHNKMPHGGFVIRSGHTGWDKKNKSVIEYSLKLDSNPEFTASVIVSYCRAVYRLSRENNYGCKSVFDIPLRYLSSLSDSDLRSKFL